jgi:pimeloyl-ACP methyl ester carboxylesterase
MQKLRVLCLHGYHGSARVLRDQMKILTEGMEHLVDFVYVDAPSRANGDFGWWHAVRDGTSTADEDPGVSPGVARYKGWTRTYAWVVSLFEREAPFDGVFGFSQGAALTALLVGLRSHGGTTSGHKPLAFDFAIMVGAFLASDPDLARLYDSRASYDLPSIHIIGRSDFIVPGEYSRRVAAKFKNPLVLEHSGGHVIAGTLEIRKQVASFLEERTRSRPS